MIVLHLSFLKSFDDDKIAYFKLKAAYDISFSGPVFLCLFFYLTIHPRQSIYYLNDLLMRNTSSTHKHQNNSMFSDKYVII